MLLPFARYRDTVLPAATHFRQLPGDRPGSWTSGTATQWVTVACQALDARPPPEFVSISNSLRSGGESAAFVAGVPLPKI